MSRGAPSSSGGNGIRVVKLGGSLLETPDLAAGLRQWLSRQIPKSTFLIVGGGRAVDAVREFDRIHGLSDADAHWLAIRAMGINARLLATLFPEAALVDRPGVADASLCIVEPFAFMHDVEPSSAGLKLPESWDVTSDSIAARFAAVACADELVLLKSCLPSATDVASAAAEGYVDAWLPTAIASESTLLRAVNFRDQDFAERRLTVTNIATRR